MLGGNYNISFALRSVHSRMSSDLAGMAAGIGRARRANLLTFQQAMSLENSSRRSMAVSRAEMVRTTMIAAGLTTAWIGAYKALAGLTKAAGAYQYEARAVGLLMGKSAEAGAAMYQSFKQLNPQIKEFTGTQVLGTVRRLIQAGYSGVDAARHAGSILNAVTGSFGELSQNTAEELGINLDKAFGGAGRSMGDLLDSTQQASNMFSLSTAQVASAMSYATEAAVQYNQGLDDTLITIGLLMPVVKQAGKTGTAFRAGLMNLTNPQTVEWLEKYNIQLKDQSGNLRSVLDIYTDINKVMKDIEARDKSKLGIERQEAQRIVGGVRGGALFTALDRAQQTTSFDGPLGNYKFKDSEAVIEGLRMGVGDSFGALERFANSIRQTGPMIDQALTNSLEELNVTIGMALLPTANNFKRTLTGMTEGLTDFISKSPKIVTVLETLGGVLTTVMMVGLPLLGLGVARKGMAVGGHLFSGIEAGKYRKGVGAASPIPHMGTDLFDAADATGNAKVKLAMDRAISEMKMDPSKPLSSQQLKFLQEEAEAAVRKDDDEKGTGLKAFQADLAVRAERTGKSTARQNDALGLLFGPEQGSMEESKKVAKKDIDAVFKQISSTGSDAAKNLLRDLESRGLEFGGKTEDERIASLQKRLESGRNKLSVGTDGVLQADIVRGLKETTFAGLSNAKSFGEKIKAFGSSVLNMGSFLAEGWAVFQASVAMFEEAVAKEFELAERQSGMDEHVVKGSKKIDFGLQMAMKALQPGGLTEEDISRLYYTNSTAEFAHAQAGLKSGMSPMAIESEMTETLIGTLKALYPDLADQFIAAEKQARQTSDARRDGLVTDLMIQWEELVSNQTEAPGQTRASLRAAQVAAGLRPTGGGYEKLSGVAMQSVKDVVDAERRLQWDRQGWMPTPGGGRAKYSLDNDAERDQQQGIADAAITRLEAFRWGTSKEARERLGAVITKGLNSAGEEYLYAGQSTPLARKNVMSPYDVMDIAAKEGVAVAQKKLAEQTVDLLKAILAQNVQQVKQGADLINQYKLPAPATDNPALVVEPSPWGNIL